MRFYLLLDYATFCKNAASLPVSCRLMAEGAVVGYLTGCAQ